MRPAAFSALFAVVAVGSFVALIAHNLSANARHQPERNPAFGDRSPSSFEYLGAIYERTWGQGRWTAPDRDFAVRAIDSPEPLSANMAMLCIFAAVKRGIFPRQNWLDRCEKRIAREPDPSHVTLFVNGLRMMLLHSPAGESENEMKSLDQRKLGPRQVNMEERRFAESLCLPAQVKSRSILGPLLAPKMNLDSSTRAWALDLISRQVHDSSGPPKDYWSLIERIVRDRNPATKGP